MKKLLILLISLIYVTCSHDKVLIKKYEIKQKNYYSYKNKFKWLNYSIYKKIEYYSIKNKIPVKLTLSVINAESGGKNVISKKNGNNSRDYGYMQVNQIHVRGKNPKILLNSDLNFKIGCWYLGMAYVKSGKNIIHTARLYNQGLNGKPNKYKNWAYAKKIKRMYI